MAAAVCPEALSSRPEFCSLDLYCRGYRNHLFSHPFRYPLIQKKTRTPLTMNTQAPHTLKQLLDARYGKGPQTLDSMNETIDTLMQHRSVRAFTDQPLAPNTAPSLLMPEVMPSSSCGLTAWPAPTASTSRWSSASIWSSLPARVGVG